MLQAPHERLARDAQLRQRIVAEEHDVAPLHVGELLRELAGREIDLLVENEHGIDVGGRAGEAERLAEVIRLRLVEAAEDEHDVDVRGGAKAALGRGAVEHDGTEVVTERAARRLDDAVQHLTDPVGEVQFRLHVIPRFERRRCGSRRDR